MHGSKGIISDGPLHSDEEQLPGLHWGFWYHLLTVCEISPLVKAR